MISELESRVSRKLMLRIIPFVMLLYFVSFLDRVNVGFAALSMNKAIGLSPTAFGLGGGLFFIGYFLCEVPSNLILHKVGARRWIARVMMSWGIVSAASAFVIGPNSFYALRFLLGVAEAGFLPGMIFYLTYWFPSGRRARITGLFMAAVPLARGRMMPTRTGVWVDGMLGRRRKLCESAESWCGASGGGGTCATGTTGLIVSGVLQPASSAREIAARVAQRRRA